MKQSILILLTALILSALLLASCTSGNPEETSAEGSTAEESVSTGTTAEETETKAEETTETLDGDVFENDNEAEYPDAWG